MRNRKLILGSIFVVVILSTSFGLMQLFSSQKKSPVQKEAEQRIYYVKTAPVAYSDHDAQVTARGRVVSAGQLVLASEVQGRLQVGDLPLKKGQSFSKGDILFRIYDKDFRYALQSRKSKFLNILAGIMPDLKLDFGPRYDIWLKFFEQIDSERDLPDLPSIHSVQEKVFLAGRNVLSEYYGIKGDEERLKKYTLRAQFEGSFTDVFLEAGAVANPGGRIASVIRTDELEVEVPLAVSDAVWIKEGSVVELKEGVNIWQGSVVRKSAFVDPASQSVLVYVRIVPQKALKVFNGMYLTVNIGGAKISGVMEIPRNAVYNNDEVYMVRDGLLNKERIVVVKVNQESVYITGLIEGEEVVVEPLINPLEKSRVEILK